MTTHLATRVRRSLATNRSMHAPSREVAARATQACVLLAQILSRFVGEHGVATLFKRCAQQLATWYAPWRASSDAWGGEPDDDAWLWLRTTIEQQDSDTATEGFVFVLAEVMELFKKLVGEAVASQILEDAWPVVFPQTGDAHDQPS
jgi:hypothetical protein